MSTTTGSNGADTIEGGDGSDIINSGAGADIIDGGSGSDRLNGGSGTDTLIYKLSDAQAGDKDIYTGGSGIDTVRIVMNYEQFVAYKSQLDAYYAKLAEITNAKTGEVSNGSASDYTFTFGSSTLTVQMIEKIAVFVGEYQVNLAGNDVPIVFNASNAVLEDGLVGGQLTAIDFDLETPVFAVVGTAPAGLTLNADGSYSFDASSYDYLKAGEPLVLTVPFTASDASSTSAPANLVITITGTNDVPVANAAVAAVLEDHTIMGNVTATDADFGETATLSYALVDTAPEGLTFNADGSYSFDASSYDYLKAGEPLVLTVPFTASDATSPSAPANLVITITGTNDVPVANAAVAAVLEDHTIMGNVTATDADFGETATLSYALLDPAAAPVGLTFNSNGSYSFDASSYDYLKDGQKMELVVSFTASDAASTSDPANLVITITGTNDVPVAEAAVAWVLEDAVTSGSVTATDADFGETATLSYALVDPAAAPTGLTFNPDGSYSFDASSYDALTAGEPLVLTVPFTASDATSPSAPANLVITITGTNDVPVANAAVASVFEDAMTTGSVTATDADAGETATLSYALVDAAPTGLTFNPTGSYSFDASSYDYLKEGQKLVLTVPFTASDAASTSDPANLVITITGTNDVVMLADTINPAAVVELADASAQNLAPISGTFAVSDADIGDVLTTTVGAAVVQLNGTTISSGFPAALTAAGAFTVLAPASSNGGTQSIGYTYDPAAANLDFLNAGQSLTVSYAVTVSDGISSSTQDVTFTITGTAEAVAVADRNDFDNLVTATTPVTIDDNGNTESTFYGSTQNDSIFAGNGVDTIYGGAGDDLLNGESGIDTIYGGSGNDIITGGQDVDRIFGGSGNDIINGNTQADVIYGGLDSDTITGEAGSDRFVFNVQDLGSTDRIRDFTATGGEADIVDVSDLLIGYGNVNSASNAGLFINLTAVSETIGGSTVNSTLLSVDRDGAGSAYGFQEVVVLQGVSGFSLSSLLDSGRIDAII